MRPIASERADTDSLRRLAVLDVGSNTVHLLVVDAHRGGPPTPVVSRKSALRLAESLDPTGRLTPHAADELLRMVEQARRVAAAAGCADLLAFGTSALRQAANATAVLERVHAETGVSLQVLSGHDEAVCTFLAARRWFGWSAGQLLVLDIGGGSLELAAGRDELPAAATSLPLGAGRLAREWFAGDRASRAEIEALRRHVTRELDRPVRQLSAVGPADLVVGTSKTFRSLARLTGAAWAQERPRGRRVLTATGLGQVEAFISRMSASDLAELKGVSPNRAHQLVAGAVVASAAMATLGVRELELCPWALREGVILRRLDRLTATVPAPPRVVEAPSGQWTRGA